MDRNRVARAVGLIAWGYLLLCFHLTVGTIVLVPNWLCYIFFLKAMGGLEPVVPAVKLLFPLGVLLGVWEGLLWGMSAVGIQDFTLLYGLQLVASVLMIYFHFQFLTNLAEIAAQAMLPQRIPLLCLRTIRTLFTTVTALPIAWTEVYPLAVVLGIVGVVIGICTCVVLFGLRKALKRGGLPLGSRRWESRNRGVLKRTPRFLFGISYEEEKIISRTLPALPWILPPRRHPRVLHPWKSRSVGMAEI